MKAYRLSYLSLTFILILACCKEGGKPPSASSPDGEIKVQFGLTEGGTPQYKVDYKNNTIIHWSRLGISFKEAEDMIKGFKVEDIKSQTYDDIWPMPWGEQSTVRNHYNELKIFLKEDKEDGRGLNLIFRVFDDGVGFRYELPKSEIEGADDKLIITDEHTMFSLTGDHKVWWIPGDWDIYEHLYTESKFSTIDALAKRDHPNLSATYIPENAVNTPVTMKTESGVYLSFHEANLTDYAGMTLKVNQKDLTMTSGLVGSERIGGKAEISLPFQTPWRTIQIADRAGDLIESKLILNLNPPSKVGNAEFFTPMKYMGIWWEMHIGKSTWDMESSQDMNTYTKKKKRGESRHGATTANAMKYIDFAASNGIQGLLVEGWNTGWNKWINDDREGVFDFITPYADYDFERVMAYAKEKGIKVIMHHETSSAPRTYEKQMLPAYDFMQQHGISAVKTGYVGKIIPKGEYHHGQWMVRHYHKVLEETAKRGIAVNAHEPIKGTGKRRTYPNAIAREGLRGQEFNAWASDGGNPPNHLPTVAFTRMLSGPIDFTPGAFNIKFNEYKKENQVNTTLAHQLALYVVIYSPVQMACDLPQHYTLADGTTHPAFAFISDVGVDWADTQVLDGEVGDYVVIARREKGTDHWFVGGITNEDKRDYKLSLSFLPKGQQFSLTLYKDGAEAHWDSKPEDYEIETMVVNSEQTIDIHMAPGGGFAASIKQM